MAGFAVPGVRPKTANVVLGVPFTKTRIVVDTHVIRLSQRQPNETKGSGKD